MTKVGVDKILVAPSADKASSNVTNLVPPSVPPRPNNAPAPRLAPLEAIMLPKLLPPAPEKVEAPTGPELLPPSKPLKPNCTPKVAESVLPTSAIIVSIMTCARRISSF